MKRALESGLAATATAAVCALGATPALAWSAAGAAASALLIAAIWTGALRDPQTRRFLLWPVAFLAYASLSLWYGAVPARTVFFLSQWGAYFSAAVVGFHVVRQGGGRILMRTLVWLASAEALFGLVQYLTGYRQVFWYQKTRYLDDATGTFINHNHFAGFLVLALGPALALGVARLLSRRPRGPLYLGAAALMLLAVVFSRSRMGLVAALATVAAFAVYVAVKTRRRTVTAAVVLIPLIVLAYASWIGLQPVTGRFAQMASPESEPRLVIWKDTWNLVKQRPWFGWGAGTFPAVYPLVRTEPSDLRWMEAHNDYLQVLCELGVAGVLLLFGPLIALAGRLARNALRAPVLEGRGQAAIAASLVGILLHEFTDFHLYVPANALWILLLAGMGAARLTGRAPQTAQWHPRERLRSVAEAPR